MKYILITLLSFTFATQITTKQVTISIDSTTEELNMTDYFEIGTGYYDVELVYANLIDFECDVFESWGIMLTGLNYQLGSKKRIYISGQYDDWDGTVLDALYISNANTTFSSENPILKHSNEGWNLVYGDCSNISVDITIHVTGNFENSNMSLVGDMNDDGSLNVYDVLILVGIILDGDSGDIFDVMEIIKRV